MIAANGYLRVLDRCQRLTLLAGAALWLLAAAAGQRRDWQDDWILANLVLPYVGFLAAATILLLLEPDNRVLAIASSAVAAVLLLIPAVKYVQPYGTAVDAVTHLQTVEALMQEGRLPASATYAAISGMHAFLAGAGALAGFPAQAMIAYVLPLVNALMPLLMYFVVHRVGMPDQAIRATILVSCLAVIPGFRPNGSSFTVPPLFVVLAAVALFAYYSRSRSERAAYAIVAIIGTLQLVIWHSTTPFMLFGSLLLASFSPWLAGAVHRPRLLIMAEIGLFAAFALLTTVTYHWIVDDRAWMALKDTLALTTAPEREIVSTVPQRMLEIGLWDKLLVAVAIHGRDAALAVCAAAGCAVILFHHRQWRAQMPLYAFFFMSALAFCFSVVYSVGDSGYRRFTLAPIAISPLLIAPLFWWMPTITLRHSGLGKLLLGARIAVAGALVVAWTIQIYLYQPLVPTARSLAPGGSDDTLLWLQEVNTSYQKEMMYFVQRHAADTAVFAADIVSKRQYERYFGPAAISVHRFYQLKRQDEWLAANDVDLLMLHWPGRAGSYGEQVELRSTDAIAAWLQREDMDLVYDNGQSFVLSRIQTPTRSIELE